MWALGPINSKAAGWKYGWMGGWVDECLDGRMDGRILMQLEDTLRPNAVSHHIIVDPGW